MELRQLDINVWVILARNITVTTLPSYRWNVSSLDLLDPELHCQWEYDVIRIRLIRNTLFHLNTPSSIDDGQYQVFITHLYCLSVTDRR